MGILGSVLGSVIGSRMGGPMGGALGGALGGGMGGGLGGGFGGGMGRGGGMMGGGMVGGGAMGSPISKALMLLLAGKLAHSYMNRDQGQGHSPAGGVGGGGLGGMMNGGGLGSLIEQFRRNGQGQAVDSWVQPGPNQRLAPNQLAEALGDDAVRDLQQQTGLPREQLLSELSETLPDAVDQLTPDGRVPPDEEIVRY